PRTVLAGMSWIRGRAGRPVIGHVGHDGAPDPASSGRTFVSGFRTPGMPLMVSIGFVYRTWAAPERLGWAGSACGSGSDPMPVPMAVRAVDGPRSTGGFPGPAVRSARRGAAAGLRQ